MGNFLKSLGDGLKTAAPLIGSGLDFLSGMANNRFNAREAEKNRQFQREMYAQQYKDNIRIWQLMNEYDLPSAQVQRLRDANLNPLLMYSNGASGVTAANTLQGASQPSGSQASGSMSTAFGQAATQAALINAQIRNINADTEQKTAAAAQSGATTANLRQDLLFKRLSQEMDLSMKHHQIANLSAATNNLVAATLNTNEMTFQTALTMRQARLYEIKRYNLDADYRGEMLSQGWKHLENETEGVKQGWRNLAIQWNLMQNTIRWTNTQIGALQWSVLSDKAMFGERFRGLQLDNKLKIWDTHLKKANFNQTQVNTFNTMLKNYYLQNTGAEQMGNSLTDLPKTLWQSTNKPDLQDLLLIPKIK